MTMAKKQNFSFETRLTAHEGMLVSTVVEMPREVLAKLPAGRVRVEGTLNQVPFNLAVQSKKNGPRYLSVSKALCKMARVKAGDKVKISFTIVDNDKLDLPEEMEAVLAQDAEGAKKWNRLTVGQRRSLVHYINSSKNIDVRIERALYLMNKVKSGAYDRPVKD